MSTPFLVRQQALRPFTNTTASSAPAVGNACLPPHDRPADLADALVEALVRVGSWLQAVNYQFITVTPATHASVNARAGTGLAKSTRDIFGWSRPFTVDRLPTRVVDALDSGGLLVRTDGLLKCLVRYSTLNGLYFAHSAFPTSDADAVFFGPDTYRFCSLIESELARQPLIQNGRVVDVGCGAGPGGLVSVLSNGYPPLQLLPGQLTLADINSQALAFAQANAQLAKVGHVDCKRSDLFQQLDGQFDLIVANPPYLVDAAQRVYRHGGGPLGTGLGIRIVEEGLPRLAPKGRLLLYTGVPIIDGGDPFLAAVRPLLEDPEWRYTYRELDPDVFGEELDMPAYAQAERIAAVALLVQRNG